MARISGTHSSGKGRVNLPDYLGIEGVRDSENLRGIGKHVTAGVRYTTTILLMHGGRARDPVDVASLRAVAAAGTGPSLGPWILIAVALT